MKKRLFKKHKFITTIIAITIVTLLGCFILSSSVRAVETLIDYPVVGGEDITWNSSLPQIIKYIYLFAVGICGAIALLSILLGAIKYIGASGNPSKMGDAKEQIFSAVLGVVVLLGSYLILNTISPDLVNFQIRDMASVNAGRSCYCLAQGEEDVLWDSYATPEECSSNCNAECQWWWWDSGACRTE